MVLILLGALALLGWVWVGYFASEAAYWHKECGEFVKIAASNGAGWDRALTREQQYMAILGIKDQPQPLERN